MKLIELKQSSITHTNEMREFLMQSESISFDKVKRLRNPNRARIPAKEKILTKRIVFENLCESIVNVQSYNPEEVVLKGCQLQDYKGIPLNANLKSLTYHSNKLSLDAFMPFNYSIIHLYNILPLKGNSKLCHLDI
jgi:hypothetical protein